MAGAAYDTIKRHLLATKTTPDDYDVIYTGDLGQVGSDLMCELFRRDGIEIEPKHKDCGLMLYDREKQDVHAGGSGCGCSAVVLNSLIWRRFLAGELKRVLFMATGALLSPTTSQQGETIPGIAHGIVLEAGQP